MYYPYLRAKQNELLALRELSSENPGQKSICPIIQPISRSMNSLKKAIEELNKNGMEFALILNPNEGDFGHKNIEFYNEEVAEMMRGVDKWIPAFLYTRNGKDAIMKLMEECRPRRAMVIFRSGLDKDDSDTKEILGSADVEYVVNDFGNSIPSGLVTELKGYGKKIIRIDKCFTQKMRNAEYAKEDDERFSSVPFTYEGDCLDGYSDYTTLPADFIEGGMLPYAMAIHITYLKNNEQINVHHFVSDSNETNNDVRGKFFEAAIKAKSFFKDKPRTKSVNELLDRSDSPNGYPGLGYVKKLSIKNHLELILSLS